MGLFGKFFNGKKKEKEVEQLEESKVNLLQDEIFVNNFTEKGGKFLYTDNNQEILEFLKSIFIENKWQDVACMNHELIKKLQVIEASVNPEASVFFTTCEHLIVDEGSILFSSKQLKENKLNHYPLNFIVYATTSQFTTNKDQALSSIKFRYDKEIPTNISAIKSYDPEKIDPNFLHYGNNNAKHLYLLLLEDL